MQRLKKIEAGVERRVPRTRMTFQETTTRLCLARSSGRGGVQACKKRRGERGRKGDEEEEGSAEERGREREREGSEVWGGGVVDDRQLSLNLKEVEKKKLPPYHDHPRLLWKE